MNIFLTIFAGVTVFVLGQFFLRLVLDPVVSLKESLGEISHLFLLYQAKITNANGSPEIQNQVLMLSATLLAKKESIPFYKFASCIFRLPTESDLIKGCQLLNLISYQLNVTDNSLTDINKSEAIPINRNMAKIEKMLDIRITYS